MVDVESCVVTWLSFFLKDGGYIVFDDFNNRTYYHGVLKYYEIIDSNGTIVYCLQEKSCCQTKG